MFGRSSSFYGDPFFGMQQGHLRRMDDMMFDPFRSFSSDPFLSITDGSDRRGLDRHGSDHRRGGGELRSRPSRDLATRSEDSMNGNPFGLMNSMFSNMSKMMEGMHRQMEQVESSGYSGDPNSHFYSQSSVMSYSKAGDGPPKVYQATKSMRQAPGGIRETHKALRDSEAGIDRMSIGRHINDRGHVITRERKSNTGEINENQDFLNMNESEAPVFDSEWQQRTRPVRVALPNRHEGRHHASVGQDNRNRSVHEVEYPEAWHREPRSSRDDHHTKKR